MKGPPLGPGRKDITWPDQVAPRCQKASSTRKTKRQTSNLKGHVTCGYVMQWMHGVTYLMEWVSWPALHGKRKRGSISNDELSIGLAGSLRAHLKGWGGVAVTMSRHHPTWICSFLSRPWRLIRLGVWGFLLILQPKNC